MKTGRRTILALLLVLYGHAGILPVGLVFAQQKRGRGQGLYQCRISNTVGKGNAWATLRGIGFLWDADPGQEGLPKPFPFLEVASEVGITGFLSANVNSRVVSYIWNKKPQFGFVSGGVKVTVPNNKDLRYNGFALKLQYTHRFEEDFPSLGGYRTGSTGFSPEGFIFGGGSLDALFIADRDFIAEQSNLPLKVCVNAGVRLPFSDVVPLEYSLYIGRVGLAYVGYSADVFVEYSLEGFINKNGDPKKFDFDWGWNTEKTWEVAFSENPMFITIGGRIRYPNGLTMLGCVPLLLSANQGSDMTYRGDWRKIHDDFPDEQARGIKDPFDPWYAKWKIIGELSFPIRFRQTAAEMRRSFLLMKTRRRNKKIDIEERLQQFDTAGEEAGGTTQKSPGDSTGEETVSPEEDKKNRLEEIRKRREKMKKRP